MTTSNTTLTTVTSNDSDLTLCSTSSLHSDDRHYINNSQRQSTFDMSGCCSCQQAQCAVRTVVNPKAAEDVFAQKRHKSETAFKPTLREVKYSKSKATKSASSVLSDETASREQERNATAKNVRRKVVLSSSYGNHVMPETAALKKNTQDHRTLSRTNKPAAKTSLSKTNYVSRILAKTNKQFATESKAVQTTPRLQHNAVLYASTAVQCSDVSSDFDELGVISLPVVSRSQRVRRSSSKIFSPDSSSDAELLQCQKHKPLMKQLVRANVPRECYCQQNY